MQEKMGEGSLVQNIHDTVVHASKRMEISLFEVPFRYFNLDDAS